MAVIFGVDQAGSAHRERRVGGADREVQEDALPFGAVRIDRIQIPVFAVRVDDAIAVHCRRIDAPLEAVRMGCRAGQGSIRIAAAALSIRIPELPLGRHARRELSDVIGTLWSHRTVRRVVAV